MQSVDSARVSASPAFGEARARAALAASSSQFGFACHSTDATVLAQGQQRRPDQESVPAPEQPIVACLRVEVAHPPVVDWIRQSYLRHVRQVSVGLSSCQSLRIFLRVG